MNDLRRTIKAHFIHEDQGVISKQQIEFAPAVGDELRFTGDRFFVVTRKVWVYDEPEAQFSRLNIGVQDAPTKPRTANADNPAAPTDAKPDALPPGLTFDGYHDSDEHYGKTILDLVRSRLETDPDDLAEGDVFYVSACWVQPQEWRVVRSGNPFEVERISPTTAQSVRDALEQGKDGAA